MEDAYLRQLGPFFPNRIDPIYKQIKSHYLEYETLKRNAVVINGKKSIKIDLAGIAGTSFIGTDDFITLLKRLPELKAEGFQLNIRLLFTYLYSDFSYAQIEAEKSKNRSTTTQKFNYDQITLYLLDNYDFTNAYTRNRQIDTLENIQALYNDYCLSENIPFDDLFDVRFSCLPLNFCILNINGTIFYDSYSYAKEKKGVGEMSHDMPLIYLDPSRSPEERTSTDVISNHFDYIWHHFTTLLYMDATECKMINDRGKLEGLSRIKTPDEISYKYKKERVRKKVPINVSDMEINAWQFRTQWAFKQMTRSIPLKSEIPSIEKIFITFSWANGSKIVDPIKSYLEEDFKNCIEVELVNLAIAAQPLYDELIEKMQHSTMGLIFFTKDIQMELKNENNQVVEIAYYAKPNVYFEYGYLRALLEKTFSKKEMFRRLIIFLEEGTDMGSDSQGLHRHDLSENLLEIYGQILERIIEVAQTLTKNIASNALKNYDRRIESYQQYNQHGSNMYLKTFKDLQRRLDYNLGERFGH